MSQHAADLLTLLGLLEGRLSRSESRRMRRRLATDLEALRRWKLVNEAAQLDSDTLESEEADVELPAEMVAALIERRLDPAEFERIESICWKSPARLAEVISAFRFAHRREPLEETSLGLTQRLLALGQPIPGTEIHGVAPAIPPQEPVSVVDRTEAGREPIEEPLAASVAPHEWTPPAGVLPLERSRRRNWLPWAIAASILLAAGAGLAMVLRDHIWPNGNQGGQIAEEGPRRSGPAPESPRPHDAIARDDEPPKVPRVPDPGRGEKTPPTLPEPPDREPISPQPAVVKSMPPGDTPKPAPDRPSPALTWIKVVGILAAPSERSGYWHGAGEKQSLDTSQTFVTLPDSWATARLPNGAEMVLREDTTVAVVVGPDDGTLELSLDRGAAALRTLPAELRFSVRVTDEPWQLQTAAMNTSIVAEWHSRSPRLVVVSGAATVNGKRVESGYQVVWSGSTLGAPQPAGNGLAWVNGQPQTQMAMSNKVLDELRAAPDLNARLATVRSDRSASREARRQATRWLVALNPDRAVWESLNDRDVAVRLAALDTVKEFAQRQDDRLRVVAESLDTSIGDQRVTSLLRPWFQSSRANPLDRDGAWRSYVALDHREMAVRQMAAYWLSESLGGRGVSDYDPARPPATQLKALDDWQKLVRARYGDPPPSVLRMLNSGGARQRGQ